MFSVKTLLANRSSIAEYAKKIVAEFLQPMLPEDVCLI